MTFALWLTGLPASGKSSIARAVHARLADRNVVVDILESDEVRRALTPKPSYSPSERELFYRALAFCGARLVAHGTNVIFDATANRRDYRSLARDMIDPPAGANQSKRFVEVFIDCPLSMCQARDNKGTYQLAASGESKTVPGLGEPYEAPLAPDLRLNTMLVSPDQAADRIVDLLQQRHLVPADTAPLQPASIDRRAQG